MKITKRNTNICNYYLNETEIEAGFTINALNYSIVSYNLMKNKGLFYVFYTFNLRVFSYEITITHINKYKWKPHKNFLYFVLCFCFFLICHKQSGSSSTDKQIYIFRFFVRALLSFLPVKMIL